MATPQDTWPKYIVFDAALMISERAAKALNLRDKPSSEWTHREKLAAAQLTALLNNEP